MQKIKSIWSTPKKRTRFLVILLVIILGLGFIISITNDDISFIGAIFGILFIISSFLFWGLIFIPLIILVNKFMSKNYDRQNKLKQEYEDIKYKLSQNPNNQELRQLTLQKARDYYSSLRNDSRLTMYDEQAIQNDLSLIINSSSVNQANNNIENKDNSDSLVKLEKLKQLKDKGLITEDDYEAKKQKILEEL